MASAARRNRKRAMDGPEIGQRTHTPHGAQRPKFSSMYRLRECVIFGGLVYTITRHTGTGYSNETIAVSDMVSLDE